jgi:hypothetical protein
MILREHPSALPTGGRRYLPVGLAAMVLAFGIAAEEGGRSVPAIPISGLQFATGCTASLPWFGHADGLWTAPLGTIAMSNDGGWCSLQFEQAFKQLLIVPEISVATPPAHGEVQAERLPGRLAVAYRPAPGFVGTDHFSVLTDGPYPHTIPINVTVR